MAGLTVRPYESGDVPAMTRIWNRVVEDGMAFPQLELLGDDAEAFFASQTESAVAVDGEGHVLGLYILHPNNVGRAGHISNASYAVDADARGRGVGRALVRTCLRRAGELGFRVLQFNAVVDSNKPALALYRSLGFVDLGIIPGGFLTKEGVYEDIHVMYHLL